MTIGAGFKTNGKPDGFGAKLHQWLVNVIEWYKGTIAGRFWFGLYEKGLSLIERVPDKPEERLIQVLGIMPVPASRLLGRILSIVLTGRDTDADTLSGNLVKDLITNPDATISTIRKMVSEWGLLRAEAIGIGKMVTDAVLKPIIEINNRKDDNPEVVMYEMLGYVQGAVIAVHAFGIIAEIVGVGQIQTVAMMAQKMVDGLDLQGITRQLLNPAINQGYGEFGRRFYNERFRPNRWTLNEAMQLYALRELSDNDIVKFMREEGYEDKDIGIALKLGEKRINASDVLAGLSVNMIDIQTAAKELYKLGYGSEAVQFILQLAKQKERQDDLNSLSGIALSAFKKNLLSEAEFRNIRLSGGVPIERIDLEVRMAQLNQETDRRDLSTGNIKAAYKTGVIARQEADHYLALLNLDTAARQIILNTWDEELKPRSMKLNASTIIAAFKSHVIDFNAAMDKLKSVGWSPQDASLMLSVALAQMQVIKRPLSEYAVIAAMENNIITEGDAVKRLVELGYSDEDAKLRLRLSTLKPAAPQRVLTKSEIVNLYEKNFYTFGDAVNALIDIGYDERTAEMVVIANASTIKDISELKG